MHRNERGMNSLKMTRMIAIGFVTALILALAVGSTSSLAANGTVKVGVIEMLTGGSAFYGNAVLEGIKVAEAEINTAGGINGKKLELVVQDNAYVAFQRPNIRESAKAAGVDLQEVGVAAGTSDFGPQITRARNAKADAVFPFFTIEDAARFMKQARQRGLTTPWFDPVSQLTSKRLPQLSGGAATGLLASTPQSPDDIASFKAFLSYYAKVNGKELDDPTYTGFGYDALRLIARAMKDAGTTTDRAAIKAQIDKYKTPCFSICFTGRQDIGAFLAGNFYLVTLSATKGFVRI